MLERIRLRRYGFFRDFELPLQAGLTVVYGPNESGKSTIVDAVGEALWGISQRSPRAFLDPARRLAIEIDIRTPSGGTETLSVSTAGWRHSDGRAATPWWMDGPVTSIGSWRQACGLDQGRLRIGGNSVLADGGDLANLIFTAQTGIDLGKFLREIEEDSGALFKFNKNNKAVAVRQKRSQHAEAAGSLSAAVRDAEWVTNLHKSYQHAEREQLRLTTEHLALRAAAARALARFKSLIPAQRAHQARIRHQDLADSGRLLSTEELSACSQLLADQQSLMTETATTEAIIQDEQLKLDRIAVDEAALAVAADARALERRAPGAEVARDGVRDLGIALEAISVDLRRELRNLAPHRFTGEEEPSQADLLALAHEHLLSSDLVDTVDAAAESVRSAEEHLVRARELERSAREQRAANIPPDVAVIEQAWQEAKQARDEAWAELRSTWLVGDVKDQSARTDLAKAVEIGIRTSDERAAINVTAAESSGRTLQSIDHLNEQRLALSDAQQALDDTSNHFRELLMTVAAPGELTPTTWSQRKARIEAIGVLLQKRDEALATLDRHRTTVQRFSADVSKLSEQLDIVVEDPWAALEVITSRVTEALKGNASAQQQRGTIDDLNLELVRKQEGLAAIDLRMAEFTQGDDIDDLMARSRQASEALAELLSARAQVEAAFDELIDVDAVILELSDADAIEMEAQVISAQSKAEEAEQLLQAAVERKTEARIAWEQASRLGDAAALRAVEARRAEEVVATAEEYLTQRIMQVIVERTLNAIPPDESNGLLTHASRIAAALTGGRVSAIEKAGPGERGLRIIAEEVAGGVPEELSEGTADQVFLALRLAGIAQQRQHTQPGQPVLPVILDDVLMSTDDTRMKRALAVLVDEAQAGQIILTTHHAAVADAARNMGVPVVNLQPLDLSVANLDKAATTEPQSRGDIKAQIRTWAREQGYDVAERGRIKAEIVEAYINAHSDSTEDSSEDASMIPEARGSDDSPAAQTPRLDLSVGEKQ